MHEHPSMSFVFAILILLVLKTAAAGSVVSNNASLLWGPYRPNHYLGIRPRVPESLLMGLMWGKLDEGERNLRHTCDPKDGMAGWGWTAYDSRNGGTQTMHDVGNMLDITTEFVKKHEGQSAGNWALRVRGTPRKNAKAGLKTSVVFYVGMEAMQKCSQCELKATVVEKGNGDDIEMETVDIRVRHPRLGVAGIQIPNPKGNMLGVLENTAVKSVNVPEDKLWQSKSAYLKTLQDGASIFRAKNTLLPNEPGDGNMHFVQMVFRDSFEFDILYSSEAATRAMTSQELTNEIGNTLKSFKSRFASVFRPSPPFDRESHVIFSQSLLSNLLGGLSYFDGDTLIDESHAAEFSEASPLFWKDANEARRKGKPQSKGPFELLTHVPSRSVFPRGFLWDEGFHLLLVVDWDLDLALEVVRSWLALMDDNGWIAREQILGLEARRNVPKDFIVQYPHIANPPTMFWIVGKYVDMLAGKLNYTGHESIYLTQPDASATLLADLYPLLKRHYEWFRKSQSGDVGVHSLPNASADEGYRWRGRKPQTNFASGLDDFPRVEPPDITELHVDALCWVGVMASILSQIAIATNNNDDELTFRRHHTAIEQNIEAVHWSEKEGVYCDTVVFMTQHTFTCFRGYVSLFPLMTGFLGPGHAHLNATLDLLRDPDELWTNYGIRSLSRSSPQYRSGGDYWRSPIWINFNYLIIEQLLHLATTPGPSQERCREIYTELRDNLIKTAYMSWKETGFAFEQYNAGTGKGQRTQGFTGWTSLLVKIMAFPDLEARRDGKDGGVREGFEELIKDIGGEGGWDMKTLVVGMLLVGFVYVTRRKFASLCRVLVGR